VDVDASARHRLVACSRGDLADVAIPQPHQRDSIEAHPTIVSAALAISRWTEQDTE
jgi:hypothetical protein